MKLSHLVAACVVSMIMWAGIGTATGLLVGQSEEDDLWANCYVYGDRNCGPNTPWHGFVNLI